MASQYLQVWDCVIIVISVTVSAAYGLYYGMRGSNEKSTTSEYLLASRNMKMLPIALSYFASLTSTGVIIGHPAEVYSFGLQIVLMAVAVVPCVLFTNAFLLPIYHRLKSGSVYEYLELRFNVDIKNLVTGLAVFQTILLSSANVYGPSTVLSQVTGINTWLIVVSLSVLCIIYTTLGGMRAVILADVIQAILMFVGMILLVIMGVYYLGDVNTIYQRNLDTGRLNIFQMDFDMTVRTSFWNIMVGYIFTFLSLSSTSQYTMQRFMTAPTVEVAKSANILGNFFFVISLVLIQTVGLVMYATFHGCDPLKSGYIENMDQLLPAYMMKVLSSYPVLPGIIFTGILCASLSTLSSVYNSTATVIMASFIRPLKPKMSDKSATFLCKVLVFTVGVFSTLGVSLAELFPNVLQSVLSFAAAVSSPLFGIVVIGIFCPQANLKAIYSSFVSSFLLLLWVIAGSLLTKPALITKPLTTDLCDTINSTSSWINGNVNATIFNSSTYLPSQSAKMTSSWIPFFPLSSISYLWYSAIGTLFTITVFIILSLIIGKEKTNFVNMNDVIPDPVQRFHRSLPKWLRKILLCDVYECEEKKCGENEAMVVDC